jgi:hypothetical protein
MKQEIDTYKAKDFTGINVRLLEEWAAIIRRFQSNKEIKIIIRERNPDGLPVIYEVVYNIRSFCGIMGKDEKGLEKPILADSFIMWIEIPKGFPSADKKNLKFKFLTENVFGTKIAHPWHPNIRYYGDFSGKVCVNEKAIAGITDIAFFIEWIGLYLKYIKYHALNTPPYPEDEKVAKWILEQAEPNGWIADLQKGKSPDNPK